MLIHPTVERLRSLGLAAMADTLIEMQNNPQAAEMPHADWLGLLIDREATFRDNRRLTRRLTAAKLRQTATIENIDYRTARGLDRALFQTLTTSQWVHDHNHLAIVGPTGIGKSWLACALGNKACRDGFSVLYKRASRLFADLAQGEGRLARLMTILERTNLIIVDDWGPEPLTADQARDLLEIVDDRYDKGSLLITSQVPVAQRHDPTLGDAILDRIIPQCSPHRTQGRQSAPSRRPKEKGPDPCLTQQSFHRPTGPSRARRYAARGATPRHARVPPWTAGTISSRAANLDQETISRTTSNRQLCSPPRRCSAMSQNSR